MTSQILEFLIIAVPAIFASQGLWNFILYKTRKSDLRVKADLAILHDLIYKYCEGAILVGYTTFNEFDNVTSLYEIYREIGGNGTGEKLYNEYCTLPKRPDFDKGELK